MATVVKDFKIKSGLVVEGANATVGGYDVLTKKEADEDYIIDLIGGTATSDNTPSTVVKRDASGNFAAGTITADLTGDVTGNADTATALETARTIELTGDVTGSVSFDGTANVQISTTLDGDFATDAEVATAKSEAIADANAYTDTAVQGAIGEIPTSTDELPEGENNLYFLDSRARGAVDAGSGLSYNSSTGVFTADLGNGLEFDNDGKIQIDDNIVATDQDVSDAVSTHSNLTTGAHGVTGDVVGTSDAQTLTNKELGSGTTLSADIDAEGFTITNLAEPQNASDAATKGYVDAAAEGLSVKPAVIAATEENLSGTYSNGTAGEGATLNLGSAATLTIGGVSSWSQYDGILVKDQTNAFENGRYFVDQVGGASTDWILKRCTACDEAIEIPSSYVFVQSGLYEGTGWVAVVENPASFDVGVDDITWVQFSGAGTYSAGNGLTLNGTEFAIDTTVTATKTYVDDEIDSHSDATTGVHGVTGDVVGTENTQTLTNKTLGSGSTLGADLDGANTYTVVNLPDPTSNQDAATKKYVDDEISGVNTTIDNLTTDDVAEGTAQYFTDGRAKTSAAALLTSAVLTNITITGDGDGLVITAENGVDDSTTDDLDEGVNNLYFEAGRAVSAIADAINGGTQTNISVSYNGSTNKFDFVAENGVADSTTADLAEDPNGDGDSGTWYFTNARAVAALEAVIPNFTEIDINEVATQVAASSSGDATQNVVAYSFAAEDYRSAKFLVKVAHGSHTEVSEVLLTLDSSDNIAITEYAVVGTNGSASAVTADVNNGNVRLIVTPTNNGSTIKVMGTLLA